MNIILLILLVIISIGIVRVIFTPYTNFVNFLMEGMLIDFLMEVVESIFDAID